MTNRTLKEQWQGYKTEVVPTHATNIQLHETKCALMLRYEAILDIMIIGGISLALCALALNTADPTSTKLMCAVTFLCLTNVGWIFRYYLDEADRSSDNHEKH